MKSNLSRYINFIKLISILFCCINSTHAGRQKSTPTKSLGPEDTIYAPYNLSFHDFGTVTIKKPYTFKPCNLIKDTIKSSNKPNPFNFITRELTHLMTSRQLGTGKGISYVCYENDCKYKSKSRGTTTSYHFNRVHKLPGGATCAPYFFIKCCLNINTCKFTIKSHSNSLIYLQKMQEHLENKHHVVFKFYPTNCKPCKKAINRRRK